MVNRRGGRPAPHAADIYQSCRAPLGKDVGLHAGERGGRPQFFRNGEEYVKGTEEMVKKSIRRAGECLRILKGSSCVARKDQEC